MLSQFVFVLKIKIKVSFYPFVLHEISVLIELLLGHLCYRLTDVPPQPNSPPDFVSRVDHPNIRKGLKSRNKCLQGHGSI